MEPCAMVHLVDKRAASEASGVCAEDARTGRARAVVLVLNRVASIVAGSLTEPCATAGGGRCRPQ